VSDVDARLADFYAQRAREEPPSDPEAELRFRKAVAAAALHPGERVLDVGAKHGGLGRHLRDHGSGAVYTGTDLDEANVAAAREDGLEVVKADAVDALPFADGSFDCVFCLEILEHLVTPLRLLQEAARVLAGGGRAIVSVPSPYSWVEVARELFGLHDTEGHLNAFTTPVLENLAALAGFRIDRKLGTSLRLPRSSRLITTDSILARSRIYVLRPSAVVTFAGRELR
jgi:SAM-dependent methyltransferase